MNVFNTDSKAFLSATLLLPSSSVKARLLKTLRTYSPESRPCSLHSVMEGKETSVTGLEKLSMTVMPGSSCQSYTWGSFNSVLVLLVGVKYID